MATAMPPRPEDRPTTAGGLDPAGAAPPIIGRRVLANLPTADLVEHAIRAGEGVLAAEGPLVVRTGKHPGARPRTSSSSMSPAATTRSGGARSTAPSAPSTTSVCGRDSSRIAPIATCSARTA